jgi:hypothetical protein
VLEKIEKIEFRLEYCIFLVYDLQVVCVNGLYESFGILFLLPVDTEVGRDKIQILSERSSLFNICTLTIES